MPSAMCLLAVTLSSVLAAPFGPGSGLIPTGAALVSVIDVIVCGCLATAPLLFLSREPCSNWTRFMRHAAKSSRLS